LKKRVLIFFTIVLVSLTGCSHKHSDNNKEKIATELDYMSTKIFDLANKLNDITLDNYELVPKKIEISEESQGSNSSESEGSSGSSQGGEKSEIIASTEMKNSSVLEKDIENPETEWDKIKTEIELVNSTWTIVSLDLKNEKIADKDIIEFNDILNKTIISIKEENKEEALENISNLYGYIPGFMSDIQGENDNVVVKKTKNELLKAYTNVSKNNWEPVYTHVNNAENYFNSLLNNKEEIKNKEFKIAKIQNLIQILKESIKEKNVEVFMLHYKLLIENMNTL